MNVKRSNWVVTVRVALVAGLYGLLLLPIGVLILHAFTTRWFYPQLVPQEWSLDPLLRQLTLPGNQEALITSIQVAISTSVVSLFIAYPAARTLGTRDFAGRTWVSLLFFIPTVVPPVAMGMGLNILFLRLGLAGTFPGVVLVHLVPVLPYTIFTLTGLFARYELHYEYQAMVLGAGRLRVFWMVTLPLVLPGVVVALEPIPADPVAWRGTGSDIADVALFRRVRRQSHHDCHFVPFVYGSATGGDCGNSTLSDGGRWTGTTKSVLNI
jgi:ABC-type spermidine/putrescine transport system permease subunit II